jgi:opacity protein-like surface antigen
MKKLILPAFLVAGIAGFAGNASAHGLYLSLGYNIGNPRLESTKGTCYSGYQYCYPDFSYRLPGFTELYGMYPSSLTSSQIQQGGMMGAWPSVDFDGFGFWFDMGGVETWNFKPSGALSFSLAVGWEFPLSPLRMELEFARTSFKVNSFGLNIFSPGSVTVDDAGYASFEGWGPSNDFQSPFPFEGSYNVSFAGHEALSVTTTTLMLNSFFRIPVPVEGVTPYLGIGIGTFSMDVSGGWNQPFGIEEYFVAGESGAVGYCPPFLSNGKPSPCAGNQWGPWDANGNLVFTSDVGVEGAPANMITGISNRFAYQLMAGLEYRFPETPYIVGLEYRWLKVDAPDKSNNSRDANTGRWYVWDNWFTTYEHSQIALKFRYNFMSDSF